MALAERRAEIVWEGDLLRGGGKFTVGSGAIEEMPITWASRTERSHDKTSPEELIAAAHGACFAMALSNVLAEGGTPPERLEISAVCTFDVDNVSVASVDLDIRGSVEIRRNPSLDEG